jgi:hypothetical protein
MKNVVLVIASMALVSGCALAQNGIVQINQATVAASGSNRATGGFPYTITQPGSYQLSGNLTVPSGANGIAIAASNVTLDLNGFNITCLPPYVPPITAIYVVGSPNMISVRNGTIVAPPGATGVNLSNNGTLSGMNVQDLIVSPSGPGPFVAIVVDPNSIVRHNIAISLIAVYCPSVVAENVTTGLITNIIDSSLGTPSCVDWNNRALNYPNPVAQ